MFPLIDTHCHLDEVDDVLSALDRARQQGVVAIIAVGSDLESNIKTLAIANKYGARDQTSLMRGSPQGLGPFGSTNIPFSLEGAGDKGGEGAPLPLIFPALGFHPSSLARQPGSAAATLSFLEQHLGQAVALGEVGLDYHKEVLKGANKGLQQAVFRELLRLARERDKPVLIHSRYAWGDALELVRESGVAQAVFHWFTGPSGILREILRSGYFISATPAAQYHAEHRRAIKEAPLERLLLETDAPVIYREGAGKGRPAEPADVATVLAAVSTIKGLEPALVAQQTTANARELCCLGVD